MASIADEKGKKLYNAIEEDREKRYLIEKKEQGTGYWAWWLLRKRKGLKEKVGIELGG